MTSNTLLTAEAMLGLIAPFWQLVIGLLVLTTVLVAARQIAMRGPSRMGNALLLTAAAVICVTVLGYLIQAG